MREEPESLILVYLRRIDGKIDRLTDDVQDLKHRVTSLEGQVASIRGDMAAMSLRIDRIETRLDRIERRLGIVPAPAPGLTRRLLLRSRAEIAGPGTDQHAALILLDGVSDPADRAPDNEHSE